MDNHHLSACVPITATSALPTGCKPRGQLAMSITLPSLEA